MNQPISQISRKRKDRFALTADRLGMKKTVKKTHWSYRHVRGQRSRDTCPSSLPQAGMFLSSSSHDYPRAILKVIYKPGFYMNSPDDWKSCSKKCGSFINTSLSHDSLKPGIRPHKNSLPVLQAEMAICTSLKYEIN